jgi:putative superfamily III holin-X
MANSRRHHDRPRLAVGSTAMEIFRTTLRLIITEGRLLRTELGEKIGLIGLGLALTVGGGVLLIMAVVLLFVAAISALVSYGFSLTVATLMVFAAVLLVGLLCLWFGLHQLQPSNLMPRKTIQQVQKDFQTIAPEAN